MAGWYALAAAVVAAIGTNVSVNASDNAADDTRKASAATAFESRQSSIRKKVRERRILEGRIRNASAQQGTGGSSGEAGAISSISSQFATGVSADTFAQQSSERLGQISTNRAKGVATGQAISSVGSIFGAYADAQNKVIK